MSNFFSSHWFLRAAAESLFPGQGARPETVEVQGLRYDVLVLQGGRVPHIPIVDYYEERDPGTEPVSAVRRIDGLPAVSLARIPADPGHPDLVGRDRRASPLVDWTGFSSWDDFVEQTRARQWRSFHRTPRKLRKIGREVGTAHFDLDLPDHELVECLLLWKARQLRRTGHVDRFASPRARGFIHHLVDVGQLQLSALMAGERPSALILGHWGETRYSCWVAGYDPELARMSPGVLLFEHAMEESYRRGHCEFDFLVGEEPYKYHYATHQRMIGAVGSAPLVRRAACRARRLLEEREAVRPDRWGKARARLARMLQARLARESVVEFDDPRPDWVDLIEADRRAWPRAQLKAPADCQLKRLLDHGAEQRSAFEAFRNFVVHTGRRVSWYLQKRLRGRSRETKPSTVERKERPQPLKAGDLVRVKTPEEIRATEGEAGLYYIPGVMERYAGYSFRVERPVGRFYDERTKKVVRPRDTVLLEGARCTGQHLPGDCACDRGCLLFWHEQWLEPVDEAESTPWVDEEGPPGGGTGRFSPGQQVRVRSRGEIEAEVAAGRGDSGIHFAPTTMAEFCGQTFRVLGPLTHAYDERLGCVIEVEGTVLLDRVQCPGLELTGGGVCDRACTLFWQEEWLEAL